MKKRRDASSLPSCVKFIARIDKKIFTSLAKLLDRYSEKSYRKLLNSRASCALRFYALPATALPNCLIFEAKFKAVIVVIFILSGRVDSSRAKYFRKPSGCWREEK